VDLLAGMIYYHEHGIPEHPRTTMIDCEFHLEAHLRRKSAALVESGLGN
jgi:hypothetical protein